MNTPVKVKSPRSGSARPTRRRTVPDAVLLVWPCRQRRSLPVVPAAWQTAPEPHPRMASSVCHLPGDVGQRLAAAWLERLSLGLSQAATKSLAKAAATQPGPPCPHARSRPLPSVTLGRSTGSFPGGLSSGRLPPGRVFSQSERASERKGWREHPVPLCPIWGATPLALTDFCLLEKSRWVHSALEKWGGWGHENVSLVGRFHGAPASGCSSRWFHGLTPAPVSVILNPSSQGAARSQQAQQCARMAEPTEMPMVWPPGKRTA